MGRKTYLDDGHMSLQVKETGADFLVTGVDSGGSLGSKKGMNLPGVAVVLSVRKGQPGPEVWGSAGCRCGARLIFARHLMSMRSERSWEREKRTSRQSAKSKIMREIGGLMRSWKPVMGHSGT